MVDSSYRGPNATPTGAAEGVEGRDERIDERTTNESPRNKKVDERRDKGVKRTKDKSGKSANGQISGSGPLGLHTFAAAEKGGA